MSNKMIPIIIYNYYEQLNGKHKKQIKKLDINDINTFAKLSTNIFKLLKDLDYDNFNFLKENINNIYQINKNTILDFCYYTFLDIFNILTRCLIYR